jgi:hypothetical protein
VVARGLIATAVIDTMLPSTTLILLLRFRNRKDGTNNSNEFYLQANNMFASAKHKFAGVVTVPLPNSILILSLAF